MSTRKNMHCISIIIALQLTIAPFLPRCQEAQRLSNHSSSKHIGFNSHSIVPIFKLYCNAFIVSYLQPFVKRGTAYIN